MTGPIVIQPRTDPLSDTQKFTSSILALLEERRHRKAQEDETMVQFGKLKLQQAEHDEQTKASNEKKKGLKQLEEGLLQKLQGVKNPGPMEQIIKGTIGSGDEKMIEGLEKTLGRVQAQQRVGEVDSTFEAKRTERGGTFTPQDQADYLLALIHADPDNPNVSSWASAFNTLTAGMRPKGGSTRFAKSVEQQADGSWRTVYMNPETGQRRVGGVAATPYTAILMDQGTSNQQNKALVGVQMRVALNGINDLTKQAEANKEDIADKVAPLLSKLQVANKISLPLVGTTAETAMRLYGLEDLDPDAQEMFTHIFNWTAAKVRADNGTAVTAVELENTIRGFLPYQNEAPQSRAAKFGMMNDITVATENIGGGATTRARKGTSADPNRPKAPPPPAALPDVRQLHLDSLLRGIGVDTLKPKTGKKGQSI